MKTQFLLIALLITFLSSGQTLEELKKENNKLKKENAELKKENDKLLKENAELKKENDKLKKENAELKKENDKLLKENAELKKENDKLKIDNISFYKSVNYLKDSKIMGRNFNRIDDNTEEFENKNEFVISFNDPNDSREIEFSKIQGIDGIKLNAEKTAIDFILEDGDHRQFTFPKDDKEQIISEKIKNRIINAFKHIKDLLDKNKVIIENKKQSEIFDN